MLRICVIFVVLVAVACAPQRAERGQTAATNPQFYNYSDEAKEYLEKKRREREARAADPYKSACNRNYDTYVKHPRHFKVLRLSAKEEFPGRSFIFYPHTGDKSGWEDGSLGWEVGERTIVLTMSDDQRFSIIDGLEHENFNVSFEGSHFCYTNVSKGHRKRCFTMGRVGQDSVFMEQNKGTCEYAIYGPMKAVSSEQGRVTIRNIHKEEKKRQEILVEQEKRRQKERSRMLASARGRNPLPANMASEFMSGSMLNIYRGDFSKVFPPQLRKNPFHTQSVTKWNNIKMRYGIYHDTYGKMCASKTKEPMVKLTKVTKQQQKLGGSTGMVVNESQTGRYTSVVRKKYLDAYRDAQNITGFQALLALRGSGSENLGTMSADAQKMIENFGCTSGTTKLFEENLHRLYTNQPPIKI